MGDGVDDGPGAPPDPGAALRTRARLDQALPVAAERVPDVHELAGRAVDGGHVPLVGRRVADVAAGRRDDQPAVHVERGAELLVGRVTRDRDAPQHAAGRQGQLSDVAVGGGRIDGIAVRVGDGRGGRDLGASGPRGVSGRGEPPANAARGRIEGDRPPVRGRDDDEAAHRDRRRVDGAGQCDLPTHEPLHVRVGDPGRRPHAVAGAVEAEARPASGRLRGAGRADRGERNQRDSAEATPRGG